MAFRFQLLLASLVMMPSAYLHSIAVLIRQGKASLGYVILAPVILPITAIVNGYTMGDDQPSAHFNLEWSQFLKVYQGATESDGSVKDLVCKMRDSLKVARAIYLKTIGQDGFELDESILNFQRMRLWALSTQYPLQKLREIKMSQCEQKISLKEGTTARAVYRGKHEGGGDKSEMIGF